ncbi:MAG: hypothetical protein LBU73_04625 [Helicobacteraceae bacterium]|nr:hypothetical protein [Helicobacteraceae bacterium]
MLDFIKNLATFFRSLGDFVKFSFQQEKKGRYLDEQKEILQKVFWWRYFFRVFVGLAVSFILVIGYIPIYSKVKRTDFERTQEQFVEVFKVLTDDVFNNVFDVIHTMIPPILEAKTRDWKILTSLVTKHVYHSDLINSIFVLNPEKELIYSTGPSSTQLFEYMRASLYAPQFDKQATTGKPFVLTISTKNGPVMIFVEPFYNKDDGLTGYGIATLYLRELALHYQKLMIRTFDESEMIDVMLISYDGDIYLNNQNPEILYGEVCKNCSNFPKPLKAYYRDRSAKISTSYYAPIKNYDLAIVGILNYSLYNRQMIRLVGICLGFWLVLATTVILLGHRYYLLDLAILSDYEDYKLLLNGKLKQALHERNETDKKRRKVELALAQSNKNAALSDTLSMIAHQWRQPLNTISLHAQDMLDVVTFGKVDENYIKNVVSKIMQELKYLSNTIEEFRNFFTGKNKFARFNVINALLETKNLVEKQFEHHKIEIVFLTSGAKIYTYGLESEFSQAILIILNNAKDAIVMSGVAEGRVQISVHWWFDKEMIIEIQDNGGGIPEEYLARIYEPYFTTKDKKKGTGIGLYMARLFIEEHMKGEIKVKNIHSGATFIIKLPIA